MDDRKKNKLLNILMAAAVAVIALCAVMAVGSVRGWFDGVPKVQGDFTTAGRAQDGADQTGTDTAGADSRKSKEDSASGKDEKEPEGQSSLTSRRAGSTPKASGSGTSSNASFPSGAGSSKTQSSTAETGKPGKSSGSGNAGKSGSKTTDNSKKKDSGSGTRKKTCTVTITCEDILDNLEDLKKEKYPFIPKDGIIIRSIRIPLSEGDTVYDVTRRACTDAGIQLEAAYTPVYGSYYVEGINQLYEFDCGSQSGWIYTVNGESPDFGCSDYRLREGDKIKWNYTCTGRK